MPDTLQRFVDAQNPVFERVLAELARGEKRSHWMWFVFPQIAGLGHSEMSRKYAIASREEAIAYVGHPILGTRLVECTRLVNAVEGRSVSQIFGHPDDMKFHSSMTLFARAVPEGAVFGDALARYFGGREDEATLARM
jgi:uncharacterized protein (DUF1810 family)